MPSQQPQEPRETNTTLADILASSNSRIQSDSNNVVRENIVRNENATAEAGDENHESKKLKETKGKVKRHDDREPEYDTSDEGSYSDASLNSEEYIEEQRLKAVSRLKKAENYNWALEDRVQFLEKALLNLTGAKLVEPKLAGADVEANTKTEDNLKINEEPLPRQETQAMPRVQTMTWLEYCIDKGCDTPDNAATIDVLLEEAVPFSYGRKATSSTYKKAQPQTERELIAKAKDLDRLPERIRINSRPIQELLKDLSQSDDIYVSEKSSLVLIKPFKILYSLEKDIRKSLEGAEQSLLDLEEVNSSTRTTQESERITEFSIEIEEFRCLVKVIDIFLKPIQLRLAPESFPTTIRFEELWLLFRPGFLVVVEARDTIQRIWKVIQKTGGRRYLQPRFSSDRRPRHPGPPGPPGSSNIFSTDDFVEDTGETSEFILDCYHLDFNGERFGAVIRQFKIAHYDGRKPILSLNVHPLTNADPDFLSTKENLKELGEKFLECTKVQHRAYSGKTLNRHPSGSLMRTEQSARAEISVNVESAVVIDFGLTFQKQPSWMLAFNFANFGDDNPREWQESEFIPIIENPGRKSSRNSKNRQQPDKITRDFEWDRRDRQNVLASLDSDRKRWEAGELPADDELLLLPDRVFGYVLKTRSWASFRLSLLKNIPASKDGLEDLQLPKGYREVIQSLIEWQFSKGNSNQKANEPEFDVVQNKGRGLVVLLHGAPGLGKTSTAECIAHANNKPLLSITCGALGETGTQVELGLQTLFYLAQTWDCVLLLDEADVFLAERTLQDIGRNGIVSVFLRTLEYYEGILFLTTNRVGELDEAFRSRIHMALYYPVLDMDRTYKIWEMQLRRLHERVPQLICNKQDIMDYGMRLFSIQAQKKPGSGWNGRQIRNAFQSAMALAQYRSSHIPGSDLNLLVQDFEEVTKAAEEFNEYLYRTRGKKYEQERATMYQLRAAEKQQTQGVSPGGYNQAQYPTPFQFQSPESSGGGYVGPQISQQQSHLSPQNNPPQMGSVGTSYGNAINNGPYQGHQQATQQPIGEYLSAQVQPQVYSQPFQQGQFSNILLPLQMQSTGIHQPQNTQQYYIPQQQQPRHETQQAGQGGISEANMPK